VFCSHGSHGGLLGVFCTKRQAMTVVRGLLGVLCTKRQAMAVVRGLLEGVLH
jgi:uncharacterized protein (DUF697 family)